MMVFSDVCLRAVVIAIVGALISFFDAIQLLSTIISLVSKFARVIQHIFLG